MECESQKNLNFNSFFEIFNEFSHSYKLPEKFYIIKDDHKLYLNLKHELSKIILYQEYKKRDVIEIEELECEFSNKENTYIDEVVFSFSNYEPPRISDIQSLKNLRNTKEIKLPYEEWLCFNLYYNDYDIDKFLSDGIYKTIKVIFRYRKKYIKQIPKINYSLLETETDTPCFQ